MDFQFGNLFMTVGFAWNALEGGKKIPTQTKNPQKHKTHQVPKLSRIHIGSLTSTLG